MVGHQLVRDATERPVVRREGVDVVVDDLGRHEVGRAAERLDVVVLRLARHHDARAKIS